MTPSERRKPRPLSSPNDLMRITPAAARIGIARSTLMYRVGAGLYSVVDHGGVKFMRRSDVEHARKEEQVRSAAA